MNIARIQKLFCGISNLTASGGSGYGLCEHPFHIIRGIIFILKIVLN